MTFTTDSHYLVSTQEFGRLQFEVIAQRMVTTPQLVNTAVISAMKFVFVISW